MSIAAVELGDEVSIALGLEPRHRAFGEVATIIGLPFVVHVREHGADSLITEASLGKIPTTREPPRS